MMPIILRLVLVFYPELYALHISYIRHNSRVRLNDMPLYIGCISPVDQHNPSMAIGCKRYLVLQSLMTSLKRATIHVSHVSPVPCCLVCHAYRYIIAIWPMVYLFQLAFVSSCILTQSWLCVATLFIVMIHMIIHYFNSNLNMEHLFIESNHITHCHIIIRICYVIIVCDLLYRICIAGIVTTWDNRHLFMCHYLLQVWH